MTETTPQRVWLQFGDATLDNRAIRQFSLVGPFEGGTEYVRADVLAEAVGTLQANDMLRAQIASEFKIRGLDCGIPDAAIRASIKHVLAFLTNQGETK